MDTVKCEEVIICTIARRGAGTPDSPIRVITQVFTKEGELLAERDPSPEKFTGRDMINFARWIRSHSKDELINSHKLQQWAATPEYPDK